MLFDVKSGELLMSQSRPEVGRLLLKFDLKANLGCLQEKAGRINALLTF